jgi:hypothetical protein
MNQNPQPMIEQVSALMKTVLNQNYFQYNDRYYRPTRGIAMGSPLSSTATELYLQYFEERIVRHWLETKEIVYYRRYVGHMDKLIPEQQLQEPNPLFALGSVPSQFAAYYAGT